MTDAKKVSMRGKAPKAGKGTGRKPSQIKTKTVSVRLPVNTIAMHKVDSAWLFEAATAKLERITGLVYQQPYDPEFKPIIDEHAEKRARLIELLSMEYEGETVFKDDTAYEIAGILKEFGVL